MRRLLIPWLIIGLVVSPAPVAPAHSVGEPFRPVAPSVVVIPAKDRDVGVGGRSCFRDTRVAVLIAQDGLVMTAAHVVHARDELSVDVLGVQTVGARVVAWA